MSQKSLSEKYEIKFHIRTDDELETEFLSNKEFNRTLESQHKLPESILEYAEKLVIENSQTIKSIERENIPDFIKLERLKYLQKQGQLLSDWLEKLKIVEFQEQI